MAGVGKRESVYARWATRLAWTALAIAAVMSCHPYPSSWPKLIDKGDCKEINGDYSNFGKSSSNWNPTLSNYAFPEKPLETPTQVSVEFVPPSVLRVSAWQGDRPVASKEFTGCSCDDGKVTFSKDTRKVPGKYEGIVPSLGGTSWDTSSVYVTTDRSLVVEVSSAGIYWCLIIPTPGGSTHYSLFPRAMRAPVEPPVVQ